MLHQIDRKVILGLADLIHIHNPFLMQFVFSSGVALLILAPALVLLSRKKLGKMDQVC